MQILAGRKIAVSLISICLTVAFPLLISAATIAIPAPAPSEDERKIEQDRDKAIQNAIISIDPSLGSQDLIEGEATVEDKARIAREVEELRQSRKAQFKNLTWSHVQEAITPQTVATKNEFLESREKNLSSVVNRAVDVYIPAQIAKERMTLAKFRIAKAVRELFPAYTVTGNIKSGHLSSSSFLGDSWRMQFRQPVFRGGVLWNTMMLEFSNLDVAKSEYGQAISDLIADVSEAYFEFERARNTLREQKALFKKSQEQKRISDRKYESKIISEIEKLNTDSLYSQSQYDLETAEQELEISKLELQKFLKLESDDEIEVKALYDMQNFSVENLKRTAVIPAPQANVSQFENDELDRLIDMAYQNRPDLQVEAFKLKAAQLAYRVALGKRLPQVDVLMEFGELAEAFIEDLDSKKRPKHSHEFRVGMEVTWPIGGNTLKYTYDHDQRAPAVSQFLSGAGSRTRANSVSAGFLDDMGQFSSIIEAKVNNLEQVVELEKTERDAIREVKEAYFNFNKALIQVESAYKRMGYRDRLAQLAKHRLDTNEVQISEYLQAEMDSAEERALVYKALSDFFLSKAKLNRAIGIRDYLVVD
jgi:outer membrane protein TolC